MSSMKVVIVGGGFGGVRAALNLANKPGFSVKLVADKTYFEYHAALYRSATGRSPLEVAIPLADFFGYAKNIEVVEDRIEKIDPGKKKLVGVSGSAYGYDAAIMAVGSVTQFFGIKGLEKYSYGVKSIHEALELKRHIHETTLQGKKGERNYVVVGGGPTGVELAAELKAYVEKVRRRHKVRTDGFTVTLIEAAPHVLPTLPEKFSSKVSARLHRLGVTTFANTKIQAETYDSIKLPGGEIKSHTVIWTAGVANNPLFGTAPELFRLDSRGKVLTDQYLEATPGIFVIGDSASTTYSGMAQTALHDANFVTKNLIRQKRNKTPRIYQPKLPVYAIPVGARWSAVLWNRLELYGFSGWALRRLADLRLYLKFLPLGKALITWRYGFIDEESCPVCKR